MKNRLTVFDVVGETVQLKKAGTTFKGLCPFHSEKTASFVVTPARETWKCFGCGLGGDIFSFVMQRDGLSFPDALKLLAAKAGVEIDERSRRDDARRSRLREVLETAIAFYHTILTSHRLGQPALHYLRGRGFSDETIERHRLGWAPGGWDALIRQLGERRGVRPDELAEAGLTTPSPRGRGAYDRFRERVIFPIRDASGNAVGLGGRLLATEGEPIGGAGRDRGPKYLNSPATPLFDKSRTLYLIDRAKGPIRKGGQAVIVEGYTDALMAHQAGFDNVVASLGTALTPGQVALLVRYATKIALAYDVDPAGERAGTLGVTALEGLIVELARDDSGIRLDEVRVVRLPDGKDPDEVIRDEPDSWREEVRTAAPIVDYLLDHHARSADLRTPGGQARFVDAIAPILRQLPPVMRDGYLGVAHKLSGVEERTILEVVHRRPAGGRSRGAGAVADTRISASTVTGAADALAVGEIVRAITPVEVDLLRLLLLVPELQIRAADDLGPDQLPSTVARELFRAIVVARAPDDRGVHPPFSPSALMDVLDDETRALAQALIARTGPDPRELPPGRQSYALEKCLIELEADRLEEEAAHARSEIAEAERAGDRAALDRLGGVELLLADRRRSLDRRREETHLLSRPPAGSRT